MIIKTLLSLLLVLNVAQAQDMRPFKFAKKIITAQDLGQEDPAAVEGLAESTLGVAYIELEKESMARQMSRSLYALQDDMVKATSAKIAELIKNTGAFDTVNKRAAGLVLGYVSLWRLNIYMETRGMQRQIPNKEVFMEAHAKREQLMGLVGIKN